MDIMAIEKRVALVTGGAKRVGRAIVERLATAGFDVALTYRTSGKEAEALCAELRSRGTNAISILSDFERPKEFIPFLADEFAQHFGRLDVLVNNASLYKPDQIDLSDLNTTLRGLWPIWAVHIESPLLLTKRFEQMLRRSKGHVINMVDLLGEKPWPKYSAYSASKAALLNLTLSLARELAPEVTVNGIAPGVVEWPKDYPQEDREKYLKRVPLSRAGTPQDVAELVHFLVTSGSYITGQIIRLDGGRSIT
jgi:pteridine reductase